MSHFGVGWYKAKGNGFVATFIAQHIPALVVATFVFVDERLRCLKRNVVSLECDVGKKGFV